MALVENRARHVIYLTGGRALAPTEQANVDPNAENEAAWIAAGDLVIVDGTVPPPPEPHTAQVPTYVGTVAPVDDGPFLWFQTDGTGAVIDILTEA